MRIQIRQISFWQHQLTVFLFAGVLGLAFSIPAMAESVPTPMKVGYVDMGRIVADSAPARQAEKKMEKEFAKRQKDLLDQQTFIKALADKYEKDAPNLSVPQRALRQKDLVDLTNEWNRKQKEFQEDLDRRRYEELRKVMNRAGKAAAEVAKARGFGMVLEDALYIDPAWNLTNDVMKILNSEVPPAKAGASDSLLPSFK